MVSLSNIDRIRTTELAQHVGEVATLAGWVYIKRRLGGINFLVLRDGFGTAQVAVTDAAALAPLDGLQNETVVLLQGRVVAQPQAPGGYELIEPLLQVVVPVTEPVPFPINKPQFKANLDTYLDHAPVALRNIRQRSIFRLAMGVTHAFREYLDAHGFTEIHTPKIVSGATESGANVFSLDYFGQEAFLAQSPQLYKQVMTGVYERVYEVGPVFRAEPHDTIRHINEYVSLDLEMAFIEDHTTIMVLLNGLLAAIVANLNEVCGDDLARIGARLPVVPQQIPSVYFPDAQQWIYEHHGMDVRSEPDLSPQDERWLGEWAREEHGSDFLFVVGYPMAKRPFYTHPNPADPRYSNSFDLLFRGVEMVTGGQRLNLYVDYLAAMARAGIPAEPFAWYLEAFRYGIPPEGGFAIGLERLLMQLSGAPNIRLVTLFPRDLKRVTP